MFMRSAKKKEGKPLKETADMKMWKKEYEEMDVEEHHAKLRALGLGEEDMKEFDQVHTLEKSGDKAAIDEYFSVDENELELPKKNKKK